MTEEEVEEEEEDEAENARKKSMTSNPSPFESVAGLGESRWETSPTRVGLKDEEDEREGGDGGGKGVLGLLYQFQKAQTDGRPGVNI